MANSNLKYFIMFIFIFCFLIGCQKQDLHLQPSVSSKHEKTSTDHTMDQNAMNHLERKIQSLEVIEEQFEYIVGWLNNETILFIEHLNDEYVITSYNVYSGEKKRIYSSHIPILQAILSPSKTHLLIHTSPTVFEADVKVIELKEQKLIYHDRIESSEISFEWNGYDESKLFVVAFLEDWTFHTYIVNIQKKVKEEIDMPYPFAIWNDTSVLLTLDWGNDSLNMTAPILRFHNDTKDFVLKNEKYYFLQGWKGITLALGVNKDHENITDFKFYNDKWELVQKLSFPYLTEYTNREIPRFDLVDDHTFFIVAPRNCEEENIHCKFDLVKVDLFSGKQEIIIENVANEPILPSPDGDLVLSGFQFENVIQVNKKKIEPFLKIQ